MARRRRDVYVQTDRLLLVATDRHSSFERNIAIIPGKGAVLNLLSAFWFERTGDIVRNHVLAVPDANVTLATRCTPLPIEAVMRGFLTGVTSTSLWTHYSQGRRDFGDFVLPEAIQKNQALPEPVFTPSTKEATHDKTVDKKYLVDNGLIAPDLLDEVEHVSRRLFARGTEIAHDAGLILVDTKYEFGLDVKGKLVLIDEVHTPDSSRTGDRRATRSYSRARASRTISTRNCCGAISPSAVTHIRTRCPRFRMLS